MASSSDVPILCLKIRKMLQVSCSCIVLNSACSSGLHSESARGSAHTSLCPFSINKTPSDYDILLPPQGSLPRLEHIPTYPAPTHHPFIQQPQLSQPVSSVCFLYLHVIFYKVWCDMLQADYHKHPNKSNFDIILFRPDSAVGLFSTA